MTKVSVKDVVSLDSLELNDANHFREILDGNIFQTKGPEEIYAIASINGNSSNYSTSVSFSTRGSSVAFVVSSTTGSLSLDVNGATISGTGTLRGFLDNRDGASSDGKYYWSLYIKSNNRIVPPEEITIVFVNPNA